VAHFDIYVVADWHTRDSDGLVINQYPQFFTFTAKAASVPFYGCDGVTLSVENWYIVHKFTGDL
jgi:hypothetical protein